METVLAQWKEPHLEQTGLPKTLRAYILCGAVLIGLAFVGLGIWLKAFSYFIGAGVMLIAAYTLTNGGKAKHSQREITLTSERLTIDKKSYALADIAGL